MCLFIPIDVRRNFRLFPTVLPNVPGHCDQCGETYDQVALETYLTASAYEGETVRDRGVWSRAFIEGFEARRPVHLQKCGTVSACQLCWVQSAAVSEEEQRKLSP